MNPPRRDTGTVPECTGEPGQPCTDIGYMVMRFVADNPGVWFFHCYIDFHLLQGLAMTFVESAASIRNGTAIPALDCASSVTQELTGYSHGLAIFVVYSLILVS